MLNNAPHKIAERPKAEERVSEPALVLPPLETEDLSTTPSNGLKDSFSVKSLMTAQNVESDVPQGPLEDTLAIDALHTEPESVDDASRTCAASFCKRCGFAGSTEFCLRCGHRQCAGCGDG